MLSVMKRYFMAGMGIASCLLFPTGLSLAQEASASAGESQASTPKNDRELAQSLIASSNPDERNLGYLIKFVSESSSLSGATKLCDEGEYRAYMTCADSIFDRWSTLMKRGMPDVSLKGKSSQQVIAHMWGEQEKAIAARIGKPSPQLCEDILAREHRSRIWGFCDREKIEEQIKNGTQSTPSSGVDDLGTSGDGEAAVSPNSTLK